MGGEVDAEDDSRRTLLLDGLVVHAEQEAEQFEAVLPSAPFMAESDVGENRPSTLYSFDTKVPVGSAKPATPVDARPSGDLVVELYQPLVLVDSTSIPAVPMTHRRRMASPE